MMDDKDGEISPEKVEGAAAETPSTSRTLRRAVDDEITLLIREEGDEASTAGPAEPHDEVEAAGVQDFLWPWEADGARRAEKEGRQRDQDRRSWEGPSRRMEAGNRATGEQTTIRSSEQTTIRPSGRSSAETLPWMGGRASLPGSPERERRRLDSRGQTTRRPTKMGDKQEELGVRRPDPAVEEALAAAVARLGLAADGDGEKPVCAAPSAGPPTEKGEGEWKSGVQKLVVKPTKFDGSTDLCDYLNHFDLCIKANSWGEEQAGMFLGLSLAGPARRLLTGRKPATADGYKDLRKALVERFEPTNQEETYKAFLRTRVRKTGEGLQDLQEDLTKYTRLAYPEADARTADTLVLDRFLLCLDGELRQWVYQSQPRDLQTAVMTAVGAEAYLRTDADRRQKVRTADATVSEHMKSSAEQTGRLTQMVQALVKRVEATEGGQPQAQAKKGKPTTRTTACYGCGEEGHFRRDCTTVPYPSSQTTGGTNPPAGPVAASGTEAGRPTGN